MNAEAANLRTRLWLIRHGESTWNAERRYQGQADPPLSAMGRWEAARTADALAAVPFAAIYSSPLRRALDTARTVAARRTVNPITLDDLMEVHFGLWQGLTSEEIERSFPEILAQWRKNPVDARLYGGESWESAAERGRRAIRPIVGTHPEGDVGIVTHGGIGQLILKGLLGAPASSGGRFVLSNGSISVVEFRDGVPRILRVNDTRHLGGDDIPHHVSPEEPTEV